MRSYLVVGALCSLAAFAGLQVAGCGDDTTEETPDSGPGLRPPEPPGNGVAGDGPGYVYAIDSLNLGESNNEWRDLGYDLDGRKSTKDSADLCIPAAGASPSVVYTDGTDGIDNNWGKIVMDFIGSLISGASDEVTTALQDGDFTIMIRMDSLGDQANYLDISSFLYAGGSLDTPPKFDGTDEWPIIRELLNDPNNLDSTKVTFPSAYVTDNVWVSGTPATVDLSIAVAGFDLSLSIAQAVITMELDENRGNGATKGIIAGVLPTEELISELEKVAGALLPDLCSGSATFESVADEFRRASDIMKDGSQNPGATCDAISIGIGFTAKPVLLGEVLPPADPAEDPCAMGGMGGMPGSGGMNQGGMPGTGGSGGGN